MPDIITTWSRSLDDPQLVSGLHELLPKIPEATIFSTSIWFNCAARHLVPSGRKLHVLTAWQGDLLLACVPLIIGREWVYGVPVRVLRLLGDPFADRTPLLIHPDTSVWTQVMNSLRSCPDPWDVAILSELPFDQKQRDILSRWGVDNHYHPEWRLSARVPVLDLEGQSVETLKQTYSRNLRTRLRRSLKRLNQAGEVKIDQWLPEVSEVPEVLSAFKHLEDLSWKGKSGVGIFSTPDRMVFFVELSKAFAAQGYLEVATMKLNGILISYRYGFRFANTFLDYNLAFDQKYNRLSPGRILLDQIILNSAQQNLRAVDASRASMTTGHLLSEWPTRHIEHYRLWLFAPSILGRATCGMFCRVRPWIQNLRQFIQNNGTQVAPGRTKVN